MDEISVVWGLDELCRLPADKAGRVVQVAAEMGRPCRRSAGMLVVNSPFAGRQVALIVESRERGTALELGGTLHELLADASARVNLVRLTGRTAALPLGGHVLLWLADAAGPSPLVVVPGQYFGSTRLASLLKEELSSAARLTPDAEVLLLEAPRGSLPSGMPAVMIECPPAPAGTARHWAAGLKQGLARHFSGEGTSLSGFGAEDGGEEAVRMFWRRLAEALPEARLTAVAKAVFHLDDAGPAAKEADVPADAPAGPVKTPVKTLLNRAGSHQSGTNAVRAAMARFQGMAGRGSLQAPQMRAPAPGFRYPESPYPVSMAPFQRPVAVPRPQQGTVPFPRFQGPVRARSADASAGPDAGCAPGVSPLR